MFYTLRNSHTHTHAHTHLIRRFRSNGFSNVLQAHGEAISSKKGDRCSICKRPRPPASQTIRTWVSAASGCFLSLGTFKPQLLLTG